MCKYLYKSDLFVFGVRDIISTCLVFFFGFHIVFMINISAIFSLVILPAILLTTAKWCDMMSPAYGTQLSCVEYSIICKYLFVIAHICCTFIIVLISHFPHRWLSFSRQNCGFPYVKYCMQGYCWHLNGKVIFKGKHIVGGIRLSLLLLGNVFLSISHIYIYIYIFCNDVSCPEL